MIYGNEPYSVIKDTMIRLIYTIKRGNAFITDKMTDCTDFLHVFGDLVSMIVCTSALRSVTDGHKLRKGQRNFT